MLGRAVDGAQPSPGVVTWMSFLEAAPHCLQQCTSSGLVSAELQVGYLNYPGPFLPSSYFLSFGYLQEAEHRTRPSLQEQWMAWPSPALVIGS